MTDVGRSLVTAFDYVWDRFTARSTLVGLAGPQYGRSTAIDYAPTVAELTPRTMSRQPANSAC